MGLHIGHRRRNERPHTSSEDYGNSLGS